MAGWLDGWMGLEVEMGGGGVDAGGGTLPLAHVADTAAWLWGMDALADAAGAAGAAGAGAAGAADPPVGHRRHTGVISRMSSAEPHNRAYMHIGPPPCIHVCCCLAYRSSRPW
jgi:hypothetical protein